MSSILNLNTSYYHMTPCDASLHDIESPFKNLPSLEESLRYGSLEGIDNPFADLPSLEKNLSSFKTHRSENFSKLISGDKESSAALEERVTGIALEILNPPYAIVGMMSLVSLKDVVLIPHIRKS